MEHLISLFAKNVFKKKKTFTKIFCPFISFNTKTRHTRCFRKSALDSATTFRGEGGPDDDDRDEGDITLFRVKVHGERRRQIWKSEVKPEKGEILELLDRIVFLLFKNNEVKKSLLISDLKMVMFPLKSD